MSRARRVGLAVGAVAILAGVAVAVQPSLAGGFSPSRAFVAILGVVALVQGFRAVRGRWRGELDEADPPDPEDRADVRVPGTTFDELLGSGSVPGRRQGEHARQQIRDRLRAATVGVLRRTDGVESDEAEDRLLAGTWTDDPHASAFFTGEFPDLPVSERLRLAVAGESGFQRRARHVVAVLADRMGIQSGSPTRYLPPDPGDEEPDPVRPGPTDRETGRWRGIGAVAMLFLAVGVFTRQPSLVLSAVVGVGFAAYAAAGDPQPVTLSLTREVSDATPQPGTAVTVTLTLENTGDRTLPDVRVVDGVPPTLSVPAGSPRHGTALRPGERDTFSYRVRVTRGEHTFEPATVLLRDWSGATEREAALATGTETVLTCEPQLRVGESFPARTQTTGSVGRVTTDTGGSGLEFHSVRDYRPGDPTNRIDWKRAARTGELATLQFREEQSATVVLLVDARESAYVAPAPDEPPAVDHSVEAAGEVFTALLGAGDKVGIAAFAPRTCWLPPGAGAGHRARARHLLATHPALSATRPDRPFYSSVQLRRLRRRLPGDAQVVVFSPLVDDYLVSVARRLDAYGHLVTVVSPDPTTAGTTGQTLATIERALRLSELRRASIPTLDWEPDRPLATAVERTRRRWSG